MSMDSDSKRKFPLWIVLGVLGMLVTACGVTPGRTVSNGGASEAGHASATTSAATSAAQWASSTASSGSSSGGAPTNGVRVTLDKAGYSAGGTAVVTIANGLTATISTTDHKTNCSIVQLEQLVGGAWQAVAPCRSMMATRIVDLASGSTTTQQIGIPQGQPGTYRVSFVYSIGGGDAAGQSTTIYSSTFTVS